MKAGYIQTFSKKIEISITKYYYCWKKERIPQKKLTNICDVFSHDLQQNWNLLFMFKLDKSTNVMMKFRLTRIEVPVLPPAVVYLEDNISIKNHFLKINEVYAYQNITFYKKTSECFILENFIKIYYLYNFLHNKFPQKRTLIKCYANLLIWQSLIFM